MPSLFIEGLRISFARNSGEVVVLGDVTFGVEYAEVVAIRGSNGCGKTSLLNVIAGIYKQRSGVVEIGVRGREPRIGFVQQDYTSSLLPWFNVVDNISIPLRLKGVPLKERRRLVDDLVNQLGFANLPMELYPHQLSGGQKQRVAIARALIHQPDLLLLDEPFANLDGPTTRDVQEVLGRIHRKTGATILFVSHDLDSCIYLSDRLLILAGNPTGIARDLRVDLGRPRERELLSSSDFMALRSEIVSFEEGLYAQAF